jgi:hypothetical protein
MSTNKRRKHIFMLLIQYIFLSILYKPTNAFNIIVVSSFCGPGSVVGTVTGYGLDGPGFESRWGRDFRHLSRPAMGRPQSPVNGYRVFPGGKDQPRRDADPSPPSSVVVKKE